MGIDPSINCTGVCVYDDINKTHYYYMIVAKMTKKMQQFDNEYVKIISYNKQEYSKDDYITKEFKKSIDDKFKDAQKSVVLDFEPELNEEVNEDFD